METPDWEVVYREHYAPIRAYIYSRVSDPDLADDLAAETFAKALAAYATGKGATRHFKGWLYRLAHNLVVDWYRRKAKVTPAVRLDDFEDLLMDEAAIESVLDGEQIERAIGRLTEGQLAALAGRIEGYTMQEVGAAMDAHEGAVKALLHRARVALRVSLSELRSEKMRGKSTKAVDDVLARYRRAVMFRLRFFRWKSEPKGKVHIVVYGRDLVGGGKPYPLCRAEMQRAEMQIGVAYDDSVVCPACQERLGRLAEYVAKNHKQDLWQLAHGKHFTLSVAEVRDALAVPSIWADFEAVAPVPLSLFDAPQSGEKEGQEMVSHREQASAWARRMLDKPANRVLILDTETCGLNAEVIELAIVDGAGNCLYNRRFNPLSLIHPGAQQVHGITREMLADEPRFAEEHEAIRGILADAETVLIYNRAFDVRCLDETCRLHRVEPLRFTAECLMEQYARWYGEPQGRGGYKWQKLSGGDHSALGDARAALAYLRAMAAIESREGALS